MKRKVSSALENLGEGLNYHVSGELKPAVNLTAANVKKQKGSNTAEKKKAAVQQGAEQYVAQVIKARGAAKKPTDIKNGKNDVIEFAKGKKDKEKERTTKMVKTKKMKKSNQEKKMAGLKQNKPSVNTLSS